MFKLIKLVMAFSIIITLSTNLTSSADAFSSNDAKGYATSAFDKAKEYSKLAANKTKEYASKGKDAVVNAAYKSSELAKTTANIAYNNKSLIATGTVVCAAGVGLGKLIYDAYQNFIWESIFVTTEY